MQTFFFAWLAWITVCIILLCEKYQQLLFQICPPLVGFEFLTLWGQGSRSKSYVVEKFISIVKLLIFINLFNNNHIFLFILRLLLETHLDIY